MINFLLVDDIEQNLTALEAILAQDGLNLLKARSGVEALELLLQHDIELALLDVQMPGMDGFELAQHIRQREKTRHIPIIFITATHKSLQLQFRGYQAGAVDYIYKPIEPGILKSKVNTFYQIFQQQKQLEHKNQELKRYAEENAQLLSQTQSYLAALEAEDRRKDEFLATLGHELRNPLAPIANGLQILAMSKDPQQLDETNKVMSQQLAHLKKLVDDLLDVSRVRQGKITLNRVPVDICDIARRASEACRVTTDSKQQALTVQVPEQSIWVLGDETRLYQVLTNLLSNASKYTPQGGTICTELSIEDGATVVTKVIDNGRGIAPEMQQKVFELFTQVDLTHHHSDSGLGIGLALVKKITRLHDGEISATSQGLGRGSTFTLRLPICEPVQSSADNKAKESSQPEADSPQSENEKRILVVDDNREAAETLVELLTLLGHEGHCIFSGEEALAAATELNPDILFLDIGMPGMSGHEVCQQLRQKTQFRDTYIVAQTGFGQAEDKQKSEAHGFDKHLVKPLTLQQIQQVLAEHDSRRAARDKP
ncbi:ATP-binding response regulator [Halioxenophilus aromaticivorans]|uniref:histidine kinase n=1 Tax=Halioxenophilus aromaticivorans TaxID=1306992 RepID=A0AAV3U5G8_9ALTE